jgi:excisionase family DNA binding protein
MHAARTKVTPGATPLLAALSRPKFFGGRSRRYRLAACRRCGRVHANQQATLNAKHKRFRLQKGANRNACLESTTQTTQDLGRAASSRRRSTLDANKIRRVSGMLSVACRGGSPETRLPQGQRLPDLAFRPTPESFRSKLERGNLPTGTEIKPMHRRLQFGMRESPASERRHGSRPPMSTKSVSHYTTEDNQQQQGSSVHTENTATVPRHAARNAATGGGDSTRQASEAPHKHRQLPGGRTGFEPLIGSTQAARLLGNIHVKTLQRYARQGKLPGYQIGGHWYFRASELDSWLGSRLNSSCHPCRLREESDGA